MPDHEQDIALKIFFHSQTASENMSNDISKQLQSVNKQLSTVGSVVQVANYIGSSPLGAAVAVAVGSIVAFMLFFDIMTGLI